MYFILFLMEYGKLNFLKHGKISLKTEEFCFKQKIHFSILRAERKCQEKNWVSPTKVGEQVFVRTTKNIWVNIWNSTF